MDIKIIVATHKRYPMPDDSIYLPVQVGKANNASEFGYAKDNTGNNISKKNPYYCELTGLYWAWKNLDAAYIGLVHYRRYFSKKSIFYRLTHRKADCILTGMEAEKLLNQVDIVLPQKREYFIETIKSHYAHTHDVLHIDKTRIIIEKRCPEYLESFDRVMSRTSAHMFNMFIMRRNCLDAYCQWLFPILEDLESRLDLRKISAFESRSLGRISELLLDVWLDKTGMRYKEIHYIYLERVDWKNKLASFLAAKFIHRHYQKSF